jgi:hypothetical protein
MTCHACGERGHITRTCGRDRRHDSRPNRRDRSRSRSRSNSRSDIRRKRHEAAMAFADQYPDRADELFSKPKTPTWVNWGNKRCVGDTIAEAN